MDSQIGQLDRQYVAQCFSFSRTCRFKLRAIRPVEPAGSLTEKSDVGLMFGRITVIHDGRDQMIAMPNISRHFGLTLVRAESERRYVSDPLT